MAKKLIDKSIPRFLLVGVGNTLLSMVLMFLLEGLGYWPSTAIAYVAGAVMSFFLNRHFTFHSEETLGRSAVKFAVNVAVCYVVGYGLARLIVGGPPPLSGSPSWWAWGSTPPSTTSDSGFLHSVRRIRKAGMPRRWKRRFS